MNTGLRGIFLSGKITYASLLIPLAYQGIWQLKQKTESSGVDLLSKKMCRGSGAQVKAQVQVLYFCF